MSEKNKALVIYYPAPEVPLAAQEIAAEMANFSKRDRVWLSLMQMLQVRLAQAVAASVDENLTERQAGIAAGRIAEVTELQQELVTYRNRGPGIKNRGGNGATG